MKRLMPYFKRYQYRFILGVFLMIVLTATIAIVPYIEGLVTTSLEKTFKNKSGFDFEYISKIVIIIIVLYVGIVLIRFINLRIFTKGIQQSMKHLRNDVQQKIHRLPVSYFDKHQTGEMMSLMSNDVQNISNGLQQAFIPIMNAVLQILFYLVMMVILNPLLSILGFLMIPISFIAARRIIKKSQPIFVKRFKIFADMTSQLQENYTGFKEVSLYNKQKDISVVFDQTVDDLSEAIFKSDYTSGLLMPIISSITYITILLMVFFGTQLTIQEVISIGILQSFIKYIWRLANPISQISQLTVVVQSTLAATKRVFNFLDENEEVNDSKASKTIDHFMGEVVFENVSFSYEYGKPIIKDLSFTAKPGEMIAIVGPTGSGKTTLINLLMRFYELDSGRILVDGIDIKHIKKDELRSIFGMVLQDTWLFNGSIHNNIKYGNEQATLDEVRNAAQNAHIDHYIKTLPQGYEMIINEESDNISQGEKQLLTIARTILSNPAILILDEATSTVDTRLEYKLQGAMKELMKDKTSFVIAHRLSTIKNADKILVLKDGVLIEMGNHQALMDEGGFYKQLYLSQFED